MTTVLGAFQRTVEDNTLLIFDEKPLNNAIMLQSGLRAEAKRNMVRTYERKWVISLQLKWGDERKKKFVIPEKIKKALENLGLVKQE